ALAAERKCQDSAAGDADHDGIIDWVDNCPNVSNPDQKDKNGDGFGDACKPTLDSFVLFSTSALVLGDNTQVKEPWGDFATVANAGILDTPGGAPAQTGPIWSSSRVLLGIAAQVNGFVETTRSVVRSPLSTVTGQVFVESSLGLPTPQINV